MSRPLRAYSAGDWARIAEALLLHLVVGAGLRIVPFARIRATVDRWFRAADAAPVSANDIAWAVNATGRRFPGTTCLSAAIVAYAMLRRRGRDPQLRIGVRHSRDRTLDAHAWVECGGRVVIGELPEMAGYATLA